MPAVPAWYREAHSDTMRHFAWSFGDDNPLFGEPDYGEQTRWASIIASPFYYANLAEPIADEITPEMRERTRGALAGLHEFHASSEFWFYRHIYPGDRAVSARWVSDVREKSSSFGGGKSVVRDLEEVVETNDGTPILRCRSSFIHTERETAKQAGTEAKTVKTPHYAAEEIDGIEADILNEKRQGAQRRYW
jgi:acyl dehydratase